MKKRQASSGSRMAAAGFKPIQLWVTPDQHHEIFAAANQEGRKATQFLIFHGVRQAKKILENLARKH